VGYKTAVIPSKKAERSFCTDTCRKGKNGFKRKSAGLTLALCVCVRQGKNGGYTMMIKRAVFLSLAAWLLLGAVVAAAADGLKPIPSSSPRWTAAACSCTS
jgi:hypothetical protein